MARPKNLKIPHPDEPPQEARQIKKTKRDEHSNYTPQFWDRLSRIGLWPRALRELDRRNKSETPLAPTIPEIYPTNLARFARHGGPDLDHLRGYSAAVIMASNSTSSQSRQSKSTDATTVTPKKKLSPSSRGYEFEQHLIDHGIYLNGQQSRAQNMQDIRHRLAQERASLSPSQVSDGAFEKFQVTDENAFDEADVMRDIVPVLCGNSSIPSKQDVVFTNFKPITSEEASRAKPDFFDGAYAHQMDRNLRCDDELHSLVIPTKRPALPVVPNMFLEAKGKNGSAAVMKRQACYDGAYGARAMHALQNYGRKEPTFDGNAYTYSSTYYDGTLKLFSHHTTAPNTEGGLPEYHMTQIGGWVMTSNIDTFRQGATAFRNARDLAQHHRSSFIDMANSRARQSVREELLPAASEMPPNEASTSDEIVDCEEAAESQGPPSQDIFNKDENQDLSQVSAVFNTEVSTDLATSFVPSSTPSPSLGSDSKRPSRTLSSNSRPHKKHQSTTSSMLTDNIADPGAGKGKGTDKGLGMAASPWE